MGSMDRHLAPGLLLFAFAACDKAAPSAPTSQAASGSGSAATATMVPSGSAPATMDAGVKPFQLPGAGSPSFLDYIAYENATSRVWVPIGDKGTVAVFDTKEATFTRIDGFATAEREMRG